MINMMMNMKKTKKIIDMMSMKKKSNMKNIQKMTKIMMKNILIMNMIIKIKKINIK